MSGEDETKQHPSLRDRLDAAHAAAEQVVAEESGQLGGEVSALAVPFEQAVAAVSAAIHPDRLAENEVSGEELDSEADGAAPAVAPGEPH